MPYLTAYTNVKFADGAVLAEEASDIVASALGKPVGYVAVNLVYNPAMAFGGESANKGVMAQLISIGVGRKDELIAALTDFFASRLQIKDIGFIDIAVIDAPASLVGCGGRSFG